MENLTSFQDTEIKLLESSVVDQIAAGEVVERPSHLIKELIENSIDAGSDKIQITLWNGWQNLLVKDNGKGMSARDLAKCLLRHATSKITNTEDLWKLSSFGFRGEALSSISSVSEVLIKTISKKTNKAQQLKCSFGKMGLVEESKMDIGTEVLVENLFSNVPARLKFLKTEGAEVSSIKQTVKAMALCHPQVEFSLRIENEIVLFYQKRNSLFDRNIDILSDKISAKFLHFTEAQQDSLKLKIIYSSPKETVKSSKSIWIFVQNRWIQDRMITSAFMEAYKNLLMHHEYPVGAIYLELPADQVDINVHPTKSQVKFVNSSDVYKFVLKTLRSDLEKSRWLEVGSQISQNVKPYFNFNFEESKNIKLNDSTAKSNQQSHQEQIILSTEKYSKNLYQTKNHFQDVVVSKAQDVVLKPNEEPAHRVTYWSNFQVLAQLNLTYIVCQNENQFILVDQHAAHERVNFEKLMKSYKEDRFDIQNLLMPISVDVTTEEDDFLQNNVLDFVKLGIDIEKTGPNLWCLKSHPSFLKESAVIKALTSLLNNYKNNPSTFFIEKTVADTFATMACHSSIRAGQSLSIDQMQELLTNMDEYPLSSFCPHGRPVSVEWSWYEIEKKFGRIV